jgi:hypothetical protein
MPAAQNSRRGTPAAENSIGRSMFGKIKSLKKSKFYLLRFKFLRLNIFIIIIGFACPRSNCAEGARDRKPAFY